MIAPVFVLLFFGTIEVVQAVQAHRKLAHVSAAIGDIVARRIARRLCRSPGRRHVVRVHRCDDRLTRGCGERSPSEDDMLLQYVGDRIGGRDRSRTDEAC